jgi:hypothetical protein
MELWWCRSGAAYSRNIRIPWLRGVDGLRGLNQARRKLMLQPADVGAAALMVALLPPVAHVTEIVMARARPQGLSIFCAIYES